MKTNKFNKFLAIALFGVLGLTACNDEIIAKPQGYNHGDEGANLVTIEGNSDIYNNYYSIVVDAIRDGSLSGDVLSEVLLKYAVSVIGDYNKVTNPDAEITLKSAVSEYLLSNKATKTKIDSFINSHKAYWDDEHNNDSVTDSERARVVAKYETIEKRIAIAMYNKISGGSYSTRNLFSEEEFYRSLRSSFANVAAPSSLTFKAKQQILPDVEDYQVFGQYFDSSVAGYYAGDFAKGYLNRSLYQSNWTLSSTEAKTDAATYVEDALIPDIYRQLLVEQYILDESYNTLGRSYARKVNVISIASNSEYPLAAGKLMNYFVHETITGEKVYADSNPAEMLAGATLDDFKNISKAWNGVYDDATTIDPIVNGIIVQSNAFGDEVTTGQSGKHYYAGTKYGEMIEKFDKIYDDPMKSDSSIENDFTGSGTYTYDVGFEIKSRELRTNDYTTNGWFIKGGLSSLPDSITSRLFNISVANAVNDANTQDRWTKGTTWEYKAPANENNYVAKINGKFYLKNSSTATGEDPMNDILFFDKDASTYYVVQIEEAVSSSRLDRDGANNYAKTVGAQAMETIVSEVLKVVADNESYKTLSTKYWLEKAGISFHDDVVYDYFKSNYPELFDDEDDD